MNMNSAIVGVGLRPIHYPFLEKNHNHQIEWFEVISENYLDSQGRPLEMLELVRRDYPVAAHGVSMNLLNPHGISDEYLNKLKNFIEHIEPFVVSDHLCWTGTNAHGNLHDLLPTPYTLEAVDVAAENIQYIQETLKRQFTIENVSTYLRYKNSEMTEWEFISSIQKKTGCGLLLDVNNVYVNSKNHNFDPKNFIDGLYLETVTQMHIAGHTNMVDFLFDTHTGHVQDSVWDLFQYTAKKLKHKIPFLVEWDEDIPDFPVLEKEALKAKSLLESL